MKKDLLYKNKVVGQTPLAWNKIRINQDTVDILSGFSCPKNRAIISGLPHFRPFNITTEGEVVYSPDTIHIPKDYHPNVERYFLHEGDILFNNTNSVELVGKTGIVRQPMQVAFSNHINRLRIKNRQLIDPKWLALYLRNLQLQGFFAANCNKWIGQAGFSIDSLTEVDIPLPDIEIQRQIVARIESLLSEMREMREINQTISSDTDKLMEASVRQVFRDLGNVHKNISLGDKRICSIIPGQHIMANDYTNTPPGMPYITGPSDFTGKYPSISKWTSNPKAKCQPGDVLITVKGSGVGKVNCSPSTEECAISRQIMAIRPKTDQLLTEYLFFNLLGRYREFQLLRRGAAIPGIRKDQVEAIQIPLPNMNIQRQVVGYLENLWSEVIDMQKGNELSSQELDQLERAILAQAFRGEF